MLMNVALGAGFLSIPWAFLQIGFFSGTLATALFWVIMTITSQGELECTSRVEVLLSKQGACDETTPDELPMDDDKLKPRITSRTMNTSDLVLAVLGQKTYIVFLAVNFYS